MKLNNRLKSMFLLSLVTTSLITGCSAVNQIDIIDDQGNIIDKPSDYDKLPKGMEKVKENPNDNKPKKSNLEIQDLEELRDKSTGYVPVDKANEWITQKMVGYKELDRKFDSEAGVTSIYFIKEDNTGKELEVRVIHPYKEDGITVEENQVLQIFLGEKELNTLNTVDDSLGM